jgi:hypothetical protein
MSAEGHIVFLRNTSYNGLYDGEATRIEDVGAPEEIVSGTIVTFDSFDQISPGLVTGL